VPPPPFPNPTPLPGGGRNLSAELRDALQSGNADQVEAIRRLVDELARTGGEAVIGGQPVRFGPAPTPPESPAEAAGRAAAAAGFPTVQARGEARQRERAEEAEAARERARAAAEAAEAARARAAADAARAQQSMFDRVDREKAEGAWRQGLDLQAERRQRGGLGEAAQEVAWQKAEAGRPRPAIPVVAQAEYARRAQAARQNRDIQESGADRAVALATEAAERQAAVNRRLTTSTEAAGQALAFMPRAVGMAAGVFYAAERAAAEGNPVVGATFGQSVNLLKGQVGRDIAPVVEDASATLQAASNAYSTIPKGAREVGWRAALTSPFGALVNAGLGRLGFEMPKPELSFQGLPQGQTSGSMWEALQGLSGAGMAMGPLDRRNAQAKMQAALDTIGGNTGTAATNTAGMNNFFPQFGL
jgi:hypothetical protein